MNLYEEFKLYEELWEEAKTIEDVVALEDDKEFYHAFDKFLKDNGESLGKFITRTDKLSSDQRKLLSDRFDVYLKNLKNPPKDPVDEILNEIDDFEFEYEGFEEEGYEDHFDPGSAYGHYQTSKTYEHDDYTYKVDTVEVFEVLRDNILPKAKDTKDSLVAEYKKLEAVWENSENDDDAEALDMFLAKNLEKFVDMYYSELQDYFSEKAYDWARDNW